MDTGLSIAASSIAAATTEIDVTSENIANAQNPSYVAEQAQLSALPGGDPNGTGDGIAVTSIGQLNNALLSANNLQAQGALSSLSATQQVLSGIQNIFPLGQSSAAAASSSKTSSNTSISGQLANFWSSWDGIAQDPSSPAPRTQVIDQAQGLVTSLNEAANQLSQLLGNTSTSLGNQIAQVNSLLGQAASLNAQIVATKGSGGNPNQLVDQMNQVTSQLAGSAGVNVQMQPNGSALISIGGVALVQGNQAEQLQTTTSANGQTAIITKNGGVAVPVQSGSIAGLLSGINTEIPYYLNQLNGVANALASTVNGQLAAGYTASGTSGATLPLFTASGGTTTPSSVTAATITVNPTIAGPNGASSLAAASAPPLLPATQTYDASNAQAMAELSTAPGGPDATYQQLVENIGSDTQNVNTQVSAQTSVANQASQALQSATGVNTNTELTNLMQFQASYQASAKLVSVIATTMQSLLAAV
ncbi:MAG: flagellar hook-associated protein FlgK [Actinomycetota bacterium]|nr:flagellar hook-associated protein FlgK [Actinomycetota bacterium]